MAALGVLAVKKFAGFAVVLVFVVFWASRLSSPTNSTSPVSVPEVSLTDDEALSMRLINEERAEHGLPALLPDSLLTQVARQHSADMAKSHYFSHIEPPPTKRNPLDRFALALGRQPGYVVGENIARANQPLMGLIHAQMLDSPEHKANLLDAEYTRVGVGIYSLEDGRVWLTQMFSGGT